MPNLQTHASDLQAIARSYLEQRDTGTASFTAFHAAAIAYCQRHPDMSPREAALVVSQLIQGLPDQPSTWH